MKNLLLSFCIFAVLISCKQEKETTELFILPTSTPEQQGISSDTIRNLLKSIKHSGQEFHSLIILRHGHIIAEAYWNPYQADDQQQLYSLSKSFTSTAIGLASDEGLLSVDDPIIKFFPDDLPDTISENLSALQVRHLLSMSVGHAKDAIRILEATPDGQSWAKTFISLPVVFEPGSQFMYNSGASYMLAAIVRKVTRQSAHEYLKPRLYEPLGITDASWTENKDGNNMGASHLRIKTIDIAKLGQLYLQHGMWDGEQILSESYVEQASSKQIDNGDNNHSWGYGYGFQHWLNPPGGFRSDGAFGQYGMVFPDQDIVVAITSESMDKATTMQLIWDLVDNMTPDDGVLPENKDSYDNLLSDIQSLKYDPPKFNTSSPIASNITGKEFFLDSNAYDANVVSFDIQKDKVLFTLKTENKPDISITCGINSWFRGDNFKPEAHSLFSLRRIDFDSKVAASASWLSDSTLIITMRYMETSHGDQFICTFDKNNINIKLMHSLARMEDREDGRADLHGQISNE